MPDSSRASAPTRRLGPLGVSLPPRSSIAGNAVWRASPRPSLGPAKRPPTQSESRPFATSRPSWRWPASHSRTLRCFRSRSGCQVRRRRGACRRSPMYCAPRFEERCCYSARLRLGSVSGPSLLQSAALPAEDGAGEMDLGVSTPRSPSILTEMAWELRYHWGDLSARPASGQVQRLRATSGLWTTDDAMN
jgi:hypothetical protein